MSNQITGKLIQMPYPETGQGKNGEWIKQLFIIETDGQYPRKVALTAWGDKAKAVANVKIGSTITAHIELESREHNGRWYTEVKAWKYEVQGEKVDESTGEVYQAEVISEPTKMKPVQKSIMDDDGDQLPF